MKHLQTDTDDVAGLLNAGLIFHKNGQLANAKNLYEAILQKSAKHFDARHLLGVIYSQLGNHAEAIRHIDLALNLKPNAASAHSNRGLALTGLGRFDEALSSFDRAIELNPDYAEAFYNRANVLTEIQQLSEAISNYNRAIDLKPNYPDPFCKRGIALQRAGEVRDAIASYDEAIARKPDYAQAFLHRGHALRELGQTTEALGDYGHAIAVKPDYAEAFLSQGVLLHELGRLDEALASYSKAISIKPDYSEAYNNRGALFWDLNRFNDALTDANRALILAPNYDFLFGTVVHIKLKICCWENMTTELEEISQRIMASERVAPPFFVLSMSGVLRLQRLAAETWVSSRHPKKTDLPAISKRSSRSKIRVGYFSADFRKHPLSYLLAEMFESHDRARFEVFAYAFGPKSNDELRARLEKAFDKFIDVRVMSDREIACLSRKMEVDIAVDLGGHTKHSRTSIFALQAAPLQVNYMGYPGTMGADYMDYIIGDRIVIPEELQDSYSKKIIYLPNSYMVTDTKRSISDEVSSREEHGLPRDAFVYCCFNNSSKITPAIFDCWAYILRAVPNSVLWLLRDNEQASKNLENEVVKRGISKERLIFARRLEHSQHLTRYRFADLFLDTLPYNAHTTACDALWAELPVLTCSGEAFASRVAASLLNAVGLPELVTTNLEAYSLLAIELATRREKLVHIKRKLIGNKSIAPLFNTKLFTKHIEAAYTAIYDRYLAGLPPATIRVLDGAPPVPLKR